VSIIARHSSVIAIVPSFSIIVCDWHQTQKGLLSTEEVFIATYAVSASKARAIVWWNTETGQGHVADPSIMVSNAG
jgi:hypothetical protein